MDSNEERERRRQDEMKNNPSGSLRDGIERGTGAGNLSDISGGMGWKGMALFILMLFLGYVIYQLFFS